MDNQTVTGGVCNGRLRENRRARAVVISYLLDLLGVAVFAVSGALAAGGADLDLLGVVVIAALTAVGGGTLRDLLLDRHPIFWVADPKYVLVICAAALLTVLYARWLPVPKDALLVADALGLALFAMSGAEIAEATHHASVIVVLMGTMTGAAGGVLRDIVTGKVPLILRRDIYATAAIGGISLYIALQALGMPRPSAFAAGLLAVVALRLLAIVRGWRLPTFRFPPARS
jgi:uncharacterized membrane protein YeiH